MAPRRKKAAEHRIVIAGHGGQGVLTLGKLLCTAAMREGKEVSYLPSYGPEVRGGTANCHVVISSGPIFSPYVETADSAIIMNQPSFERFGSLVARGGVLTLNTSLVEPGDYAKSRGVTLLGVRATEEAQEMGSLVVANVILLGAFSRAVNVCRRKSIEASINDFMASPKGRSGIESNLQAFAAGIRMAEQIIHTG